MSTCNFFYLICPFIPIDTVTTFLDDFGVEGTFDFANFESKSLHIIRIIYWIRVYRTNCVAATCLVAGFIAATLFLSFRRDFVGNGDNFHATSVFSIKIQAINHRIKAVVVRAQGVEYLPDDAVVFVFVQCVFGFHACGDNDGQDDVALLFAFGTAHNATDRLHDIDLRIARGEK